jgi:hypothetical protein
VNAGNSALVTDEGVEPADIRLGALHEVCSSARLPLAPAATVPRRWTTGGRAEKDRVRTLDDFVDLR